MAIQATSAAEVLQSNQDSISSHELISLLMAGGLERISQAKSSISEGDKEEAEILMEKIRGIINGLRNSLNFDQGGEIASNLDKLYDYMLERIGDRDTEDRLSAVDEVGKLLSEVKVGWDEMEVKAALTE